MTTALYELPSRENNPFWPMPADYGKTLPEEYRGKSCLRCGGGVNNDRTFCEDCLNYRKQSRLALMGGWFDPDKPNILMRSTEIFLAALGFYVEFYVKGASCCKHLYALPDCRHKPTMQQMFTRSRSALVAPRDSSKTFTIVFEMGQFMMVTRPYTSILLGSETKDLTVEKIKEIRRRTEQNERLMHDFGIVWTIERSSSRDWSNRCLDFNNGSQLKGSSIDQATRGRHPLVGLIDDPEGKKSKSANWRKQFMRWLFQDYLNQFTDKGTHVMWIGTILDIDSCLYRAIHNDDPERRFIAWDRKILPMVHSDGQGKTVSCWPEKLSADEFERKKCGTDNEDGSVTPIGMAAVMAEFQGTPIPRGDLMFIRDERKHGYVMWQDSDGKQHVYDPSMGKSRPYDELFEESYRYAAMDTANTPKKRADESFIVVALYDADGTIWVIDAWARRCFYQLAVRQALQMGHKHRIGRFALENSLIDDIAMREIFLHRNERLKAGFHVPMFASLSTDGVAKELRIERMQPMWDAGRIKLPILREYDGYKPMIHPSADAMQKLIDQFDTQTIEEDPNRKDDGIDAMEKIHRMAVKRPPRLARRTKGQAILEAWEKQGIEVDPMRVPEGDWTTKMRKKHEERVRPRFSPAYTGVCDGFC